MGPLSLAAWSFLPKRLPFMWRPEAPGYRAWSSVCAPSRRCGPRSSGRAKSGREDGDRCRTRSGTRRSPKRTPSVACRFRHPMRPLASAIRMYRSRWLGAVAALALAPAPERCPRPPRSGAGRCLPPSEGAGRAEAAVAHHAEAVGMGPGIPASRSVAPSPAGRATTMAHAGSGVAGTDTGAGDRAWPNPRPTGPPPADTAPPFLPHQAARNRS